jgi:hypothetical protein
MPHSKAARILSIKVEVLGRIHAFRSYLRDTLKVAVTIIE